MGFWDTALGFLGLGGDLFSQQQNNQAIKENNDAQRQFQLDMYNRQRQDALADYQTQTAYNDPKAQMLRYQNAGLNENLIYGQQTNAPTIRSSQSGSYTPQAPHIDVGGSIAKYQQIQIAGAQTDNLKKQNEVLESEKNLKNALALQAISSTNNSDYDLRFKQATESNNVETKDALLRQIRQGLDIRDDENRRAAALNTSNIAVNNTRIRQMASDIQTQAVQRLEAQSRIATNASQRQEISQRIQNLKTQNANEGIQKDLHQLELERQKRGASSNDPWYLKRLDFISDKVSKGLGAGTYTDHLE